jgi:hypothetical protein
MYRVMVDLDELMEAPDAKTLVDQLWATSKIPTSSRATYRVRAARWARELTKQPVRTYDDQVFVDDMIACGIWKVVAPIDQLH